MKRVFVFSDMQFDTIELRVEDKWQSYTGWPRIFEAAAGYDMPELVPWDFAESLCPSDKVQMAPMPGSAPGTAAEDGTTLVCNT
ncbi:hypothetical protein BM221_009653 [Beauveria bassiana]|uniref:DUF7788 domain-containing protein n=1 Tax=Beauveria bassiana TaxID=176275 RepID=A0A2N6NC38_BEABA|nr:hypothetical protein BM221_009653 [Beauveria bassiana]